MLKMYSNSILGKKNFRLIASAIAGVMVMSTTGCDANDRKIGDTTASYVADNTLPDETTTTMTTSESVPFVTTVPTNNNLVTTSVESSDSEQVESESNKDLKPVNLDDTKPATIKLTAEDIVLLSEEFAKYVNKKAILSCENYKFSEIAPEDLYSVVYLANIDFVSKDETARLIESRKISDNINSIVADSFYFYELYADDTINKIISGNSNIIDLSLLVADGHDKTVAQLMGKIMKDSITASSDVNYKNYMDTVFYYVEDATISNMNYDYSKSIYETDRDKLTVGGDYTLSYAASCIDEIMKYKDVANEYASQMMYDSRTDFSNLANVFNGCKLPEQQVETSKQYIK